MSRLGIRLALACCVVTLTPPVADATLPACAQPVSVSGAPTAADALSILRSAVGIAGPCDAAPCACDPSGDGRVTAADAIRALKNAVGQGVELLCDCATAMACKSAQLHFLEGTEADIGWTGIHHDTELPFGWTLDLEIVRRCGGDGAVCEHDADCGAGSCAATCDCTDDLSCELRLAGGNRRCVTTLQQCNSNSDCAPGVGCVDFFAPPIPVSSGGTPFCWQAYLASPFTGTADAGTESFAFVADLRLRAMLGFTIDQPCPRCGPLHQSPAPGETFQCESGQFPGEPCIADAVHPWFGGTSYDCPASLGANVTGAGQILRLDPVTTQAQSRTAQLPCAAPGFRANPLLAPETGKCLDDDSPCASNADCRRCSGDAPMPCEDDPDCAGNGVCAEAPDQPVSCGFWCHCGFCDGDPLLPCMDDAQCPEGQECEAGAASAMPLGAPQQKPNDCSDDGFVCGGGELAGRCKTTELGRCADFPLKVCTRGSSTCSAAVEGDCILSARRCFENRIDREGTADTELSCAYESSTCTTNDDCDRSVCVADSMVTESVGIGCLGGTSSMLINDRVGLTGPASIRFRTRLQFLRD